MGKFRWVFTILVAALVASCSPAQGTNHSAATRTPSPPATALSTPSSAPVSPSPAPLRPVLVGLSGVNAVFTVARLDGTPLASLPATNAIGDEHVVGAYLVAAADGKEWTVDAAGVVRPVSPIAAKLLSPDKVLSLLVLDSTTAIDGCQMASTGDCTALEVRLDTGASRTLQTAPNIGQWAMAMGPSLKVLEVSPDLNTVWLREVTAATAGSQGSTAKLEIVGVDRLTGAVTRHNLPAAMQDLDLTISRDGKGVAGQEDAGTDSTHLAIRHLHVVSLVTGVDSDVQGTAPYVGGQRSPSILFAPDASQVVWWGGVNNGSTTFSVNIAAIGGTGKSVFPHDGNVVNGVLGVFWLNATTLVIERGGMFAVKADTGSATQLTGPIDYLVGVLN